MKPSHKIGDDEDERKCKSTTKINPKDKKLKPKLVFKAELENGNDSHPKTNDSLTGMVKG